MVDADVLPIHVYAAQVIQEVQCHVTPCQVSDPFHYHSLNIVNLNQHPTERMRINRYLRSAPFPPMLVCANYFRTLSGCIFSRIPGVSSSGL